ncbi:MAG TPA: MBL fold metallo-hydrolase RNA specificity domain-containing protein [Candidatus Baltobacteraceae bacterium]|nr:MBL fold metallo-hydrolase RNA specificity domain-containing protein [Candidatus Baltobacteraceae bacterium]
MFSLAERSLYVADLDLWIDSLRPRARCYVSHGHSDHAREHDTIVTTPANAAICRARFQRGRRSAPRAERGQRRAPARDQADTPVPACEFEERRFNVPWSDGEHELTLFPAGHVLGSAQLLIEGERGRFVYTGDFKLARSYTCEPPEVKRCDVLLMECTYGRPHYVFPSRDEVEDAIVAFATEALAAGCAPVLYAYSLGKAQEAMAILGKAGIPLAVHGAVDEIAKVYARAGVVLPPYERYDALTYDGTRALIWPPSGKTQPKALERLKARRAMLSGWALDRSAPFRYGVDACIPLSDHADYAALLRYIELAQPKKVLLNHGWRDFAWRLRRMGVDATYLEPHEQLSLF